jgi:hypothetical protein
MTPPLLFLERAGRAADLAHCIAGGAEHADIAGRDSPSPTSGVFHM